jgi:serine/threonine protein kinase
LRTENLTNNQKINCFTQITSALVLIHEHDISHLDIKPDNIFVVRNSSKSADHLTFKLADFGIMVRTGDKVFRPCDSRYADVNTILFTKNELLDTKKVNALFPFIVNYIRILAHLNIFIVD